MATMAHPQNRSLVDRAWVVALDQLAGGASRIIVPPVVSNVIGTAGIIELAERFRSVITLVTLLQS